MTETTTCTKCVNGKINIIRRWYPCDCPLGATAIFNVKGRTMTGAEYQRRLNKITIVRSVTWDLREDFHLVTMRYPQLEYMTEKISCTKCVNGVIGVGFLTKPCDCPLGDTEREYIRDRYVRLVSIIIPVIIGLCMMEASVQGKLFVGKNIGQILFYCLIIPSVSTAPLYIGITYMLSLPRFAHKHS